MIGITAGTAGAAVVGTLAATSAPSVGSTGTDITAGSLTITLPASTALTAKVTALKVSASGGGTVDWADAVVSSHTSGTAGLTFAGTTATLTVTKPAGTADTIHITTVKYDLATAHGTVKVAAHPTTTNAKGILVYTPTSVVNAKAPGAPATVAPIRSIVATTRPSIGRTTGQSAGNWTITLQATTGNATTAKSEGWSKTQFVDVTVQTNLGANCAGNNYVLFTGTPKATVSGTTGVSATPTVTVVTTAGTNCTAANHNKVEVVFTNAGTFTAKGGKFTITLSTVKYQVGSTTTLGNVAVTSDYTGTAAIGTADNTTTESNAKVSLVFAKANTPAKTLTPGAFDTAISNVEVVETAPSTVASGGVCLSLNETGTATHHNVFHTGATAKASVVTGDGVVTATVTYEKSTGNPATTLSTAFFARMEIKRESFTKATTYEVSGLKVDASTKPGTVTVVITHVGATTHCTTVTSVTTPVTAYSIKKTTQVIYGQTADATAAKELESQFKATATGATTHGSTACAGGHVNKLNTRPVILATTKTYQDALSSSYLAGYLDTGTLLTPVTSLSAVTKQALRTEGITRVYVVGGPLAITTTVVGQIETLPAYSCGGVSPLTTGSKTIFIHVTRIWGKTQYDTAKTIAETVPAGDVASIKFTAAYAGVNATKGDGAYNDTSGNASTAPLTGSAVHTAILASGVEFQDAMAASALAYGTSLPVLLTTPTKLSSQASAAITTLGIRQVIVMGGPLAITTTVVKALGTLGVSVLRVAGKNYTDTAVQLAKFEQASKTVAGRGWPTGTGTMSTVAVTRGNGFTDGLAGAVVTGHTKLPLLLTFNPTTVGTYLTAFLKASGQGGKGVNTDGTAKLSSLVIFGGPLAVSPATIATMEGDIG